MRRIGQAKAGLAADYAAQLARSVGKVVFFAKHVDVMDAAEEVFAKRGIRYSSIRGNQTSKVRQKNIDAFMEDPDVAIAVCSLTAAGVGLNLQVASNVVLAELSWTDAEQTQAIDRIHRIGQDQPVTAWRIIAAQTIDTKIAELIDSKAGLAARALDGSDEEVSSSADVQLEALVALLTEELEARPSGLADLGAAARCRTPALALEAQPPQPADEQGVVLVGARVVDQPVEHLVVVVDAHVERGADGGVLGAGVLPPLALEAQDRALAVGELGWGVAGHGPKAKWRAKAGRIEVLRTRAGDRYRTAASGGSAARTPAETRVHSG